MLLMLQSAIILQIMSGIYPVAQVREPYTAVGYLAERAPLTSLLGLDPVRGEGEEVEEEEEGWTAWGVCEGQLFACVEELELGFVLLPQPGPRRDDSSRPKQPDLTLTEQVI